MRGNAFFVAFTAALVAGAVTAGAQRPRMVYNPVTGQSEPESSARLTAPELQDLSAAQLASDAALDTVGTVRHANHQRPFVEQCGCGDPGCGDPGCQMTCGDMTCGDMTCGDMGCGDQIGCGDSLCGGVAPACFYAGFEFVYVKPRFSDNVALTFTDGDAAGNEAITDTQFDHDAELTPRAFFGWRHADGVGLRVTWWGFDHESATASGSPQDGFDQVSHPAFADVDLSTVLPDDQFIADSDLEALAIDIEATHESSLCGWDVSVGGGIRYAEVEQGYQAQLIDTTGGANTVRGSIDYRQSIEGFGPTISLGASRPFGRRLRLFGKARGSVLFGDGDSFLSGTDNVPAVTTTRATSRDDLLSIGEVQFGLAWRGGRRRHTPYTPFASVAIEGQTWNGAGNASSEDATLGFFGIASGIGLEW